MKKRRKLSIDDVLKKPLYLLIIQTIYWADSWDKKIRILHLRYAFVENHGITLERNGKPTKIKHRLDEFFTDPSGNNWIDALKQRGWMQKKISSTNNLINYLARLKELNLIETDKDKEDIYPYYYFTSKGMYKTTRWLLNWYINEFCPDKKLAGLAKLVFNYVGVKPGE